MAKVIKWQKLNAKPNAMALVDDVTGFKSGDTIKVASGLYAGEHKLSEVKKKGVTGNVGYLILTIPLKAGAVKTAWGAVHKSPTHVSTITNLTSTTNGGGTPTPTNGGEMNKMLLYGGIALAVIVIIIVIFKFKK